MLEVFDDKLNAEIQLLTSVGVLFCFSTLAVVLFLPHRILIKFSCSSVCVVFSHSELDTHILYNVVQCEPGAKQEIHFLH